MSRKYQKLDRELQRISLSIQKGETIQNSRIERVDLSLESIKSETDIILKSIDIVQWVGLEGTRQFEGVRLTLLNARTSFPPYLSNEMVRNDNIMMIL